MIQITDAYLASQGLSPTFAKRFWSKVQKTNGCWLWSGAKYLNGYGAIGRWKEGDIPLGAHVASWILHFGPVPDGLNVLHHCDNRCCVRPDHLWMGTQKQNVEDMMRKGRYRLGLRCRGETNKRHKLVEWQVRQIKSRYIRGHKSRTTGNSAQLADEFGVSVGTIRKIAAGTAWAHISGAIES